MKVSIEDRDVHEAEVLEYRYLERDGICLSMLIEGTEILITENELRNIINQIDDYKDS